MLQAIVDGITMIVDFITTLFEFVLNIVDMTLTALLGLFQLLPQVANVVNTVAMFEDFFSPIAWVGVLSVVGLVVTLVVFRLVTRLAG